MKKRGLKAAVVVGILAFIGLGLSNCGELDKILKDIVRQTSVPGVYVGIVTFGNEVRDITDYYPVYLGSYAYWDENGDTQYGYGADDLKAVLDKYTRAGNDGTKLYYAINKTLDNIKNKEAAFPNSLDAVYMITFTDGLDEGSAAAAGDDTEAEYKTATEERIKSFTVRSKNITAYSVGLAATDKTAPDSDDFAEALKGLAGGEDSNKTIITDGYDKLAEELATKATSLDITTTTSAITFTSAAYANRDIVRWTFDDAASGGDSTSWIEGTIAKSGNNYVFEDMKASAGVTARVELTYRPSTSQVTVRIFNATGVTFNKDFFKQWKKKGNAYQASYEYSSGTATQNQETEKKSVIIYLLLDNSRSISDGDINKVRAAAKAFIDALDKKGNPISYQ
ncbi:MAG: VWA domain-containing protein [Treponema sp.]|jgi:hypothetical protein|nr:VWA domain-containing protein [Treponema sp.]